MAKKFTFNKEAEQSLENLRVITMAKSTDDVIRDAMTLYEDLVCQVRYGSDLYLGPTPLREYRYLPLMRIKDWNKKK